MGHADGQERDEAERGQVRPADRPGQRRSRREHPSARVETVRQSSGERSGYNPDGGAGRQDEANPFHGETMAA